MIVLSPLIGQASGRLGDLVFVRGPRGGYVRSWVAPDETATTERQAIWDAMAAIAPSWATLTDVQRENWRRFSLDHPRPNRLGQLHPVGGFQEYTRANLIRLQANNLLGSAFGTIGNPHWDEAVEPTLFPTWSLVTATGVLTTSLGAAGQYSSSTQAGFALWASEPGPGSRTAYYGAWTLIAAPNKPGTVSSFTTTLAVGHRPATGDSLFTRVRYFDEKGHVGPIMLGKLIAP